MSKLILTMEEAIKVVREHYNLPDSVEIQIGDQVAPHNDYAWQDIPKDWVENSPPPSAVVYDRIEVMTDIGMNECGSPHDWGMGWGTDNGYFPKILKFRKCV
jgi:hypothetical protein